MVFTSDSFFLSNCPCWHSNKLILVVIRKDGILKIARTALEENIEEELALLFARVEPGSRQHRWGAPGGDAEGRGQTVLAQQIKVDVSKMDPLVPRTYSCCHLSHCGSWTLHPSRSGQKPGSPLRLPSMVWQ